MNVSNLGTLIECIEKDKFEYKKLLGSPGAAEHADPKLIYYYVDGVGELTVSLGYARLDSPIGFPYHRMKCYLKLNGARVTMKELLNKELLEINHG